MVGGLSPVPEGLRAARVEIDAIDDAMVDLLVRRLKVVEKVVAIKAEAGIPALLPDRVEEVVERVCARARSLGLPPDLPESLWREIIAWTIRYENTHLPTGAPGASD